MKYQVMAFRKRRHDSGSDSDEEKLPIDRDNDDELKAVSAMCDICLFFMYNSAGTFEKT